MVCFRLNPRPLTRFLISCAGFALCSVLLVPISRAQSTDNSSPSPAAAQTPSPDSAKPAKPKHVITNDDLEPHSSGASSKDGKLVGTNPLLECDAPCEHAAYNYLGYDSENEAEWHEQIVQARRELAADATWRGQLNQAIAQTRYYCNFLAQQSQQTAPSGNDYRSRTERARNSQYFQNMDQSLRRSMEATMNQMQQRIQEVAVLSRVRAALMYVQADRIFNSDCDPPSGH